MLSKIASAVVFGLSGKLIEVETDITTGFPSFSIVGLPDVGVKEAKERVRSAIRNSGYLFPNNHRIVVNLAPGDVQKVGPSYDLPMALGILVSAKSIPALPGDVLVVGELALDGRLRSTNGVLPLTLLAKKHGFKKIIVPLNNESEARLVHGIDVICFESLHDVILWLQGKKDVQKTEDTKNFFATKPTGDENDFCFIKGQEHAKRALEVAASGAHNVLLSGPPGSGKTLLARSLPSILPTLTKDEALEVTSIYSVAGVLAQDNTLMCRRPFRAPHHSASLVALVGGGKHAHPGEISFAHRGVLFLDEFPEFPRSIMEALRQPLEDGQVSVARAYGSVTYPARCMLVASRNPCPCGFYGDSARECTCTTHQVFAYKKRISGPLLDRIDICVQVPRIEVEKLSAETNGETSYIIQQRVEKARARQRERFFGTLIASNTEMTPADVKKFCSLHGGAKKILAHAVEKFNLSARSYYRVIKVSQTVADLANSDIIFDYYVAEALQFRFVDE